MGARGPVPNRSDDLSRDRDANRGDRPEITKGELLPLNEVLAPNPDWEPIAIELYESLMRSGQSAFYQDSDMALAWSICDDLSYAKRSKQRSGQLLQTIYSALSNLLVTEGDRRRVRLELTAPDTSDEEATVLTLADYATDLGIEDDD